MFNLFQQKKSAEQLIKEANLPSDYRILQLSDGRYIHSYYLGLEPGEDGWIDYEAGATKDLKKLLEWVAYKIKRKAEKSKIEEMPRKVIGGTN